MTRECFLCHGQFEESDMIRYEDPLDSEVAAHVCVSCNSDNSRFIVYTGHNHERLPVGLIEDTITAYDAEDHRCMHDPRVFYDDCEYMHCGNCQEAFYGSMQHIEDADEYWCTYCADHHAHFCDYDDCLYANVGNMPNEEDEERHECRQNRESADEINGFRVFRGVETPRFLSEPLVGIEFEHAPVRRGKQDGVNEDLFRFITNGRDLDGSRWADRYRIHGDGSIKWQEGYGSSEILSMPSSGHQLERVIRRFYEPFASGEFNPGPEHHSCGFHMHVASEYLFMMKRGMQDPSRSSFPRDVLTTIHKICKEFISSSRRKNSYCSGPVGIRDKNMSESGTNAMRQVFNIGGYPGICVRTFGTIEFRVWPSSNSVRNTLARAELSQKLIKWWDSVLIKDGQFHYNQEEARKLDDIAALCICGARSAIPEKLGELLGLSADCVEDLKRMSERFNPFSNKKTMFAFTQQQLACMEDEPTEVGLDFGEFHKISNAGDTTAMMCDNPVGYESEYIAFGEALKCYDEPNEDRLMAMVAQFAKGEI